MNCQSCGHDNVDDAQLCDQRGSDFAPVCPACKTENKVGGRYEVKRFLGEGGRKVKAAAS